MKQIESGIALVSDLNFRAPSPTFEFPIGQFENMLEVLTLMGAKVNRFLYQILRVSTYRTFRAVTWFINA